MGKMKYLGARVEDIKISKPKRAEIWCMSNLKGGVGKSTSVQALSEALAIAGYKVLAVDLDVQQNLSRNAGVEPTEGEITLRNIMDAMIEDYEITEEIVKGLVKDTNGGYSLIRCQIDMFDIDDHYGKYDESAKITLIRNILEYIRAEYHYILIDTPPNLNLLTKNAYCAADKIYVPMQTNIESTDGLGLVLPLCERIKTMYNPSLEVAGLFFTMVEDGATPRKTFSAMVENAEERGLNLMESFIRKSKHYDSLHFDKTPLGTQLLKNVQLAQYLLMINEMTGKILFRLMMEET